MEQPLTKIEQEMREARQKARQKAHLERMARPFKATDSQAAPEPHISDEERLIMAEVKAMAEVAKKYIEKAWNGALQSNEYDVWVKENYTYEQWLKEKGII
jgi:hypothetical protein